MDLIYKVISNNGKIMYLYGILYRVTHFKLSILNGITYNRLPCYKKKSDHTYKKALEVTIITNFNTKVYKHFVIPFQNLVVFI